MQSAGDFMHPVISLRKAYSIWVCLRPPKGTENTITRYRFSKEDVVGFVEDDSAEYDVMTVVMVRLGEPGTAGYNGILGLLGTLLSREVPNDEKFRVLSDEHGIEPGAGLKEGAALVGTLGELIYGCEGRGCSGDEDWRHLEPDGQYRLAHRSRDGHARDSHCRS